MATLMGSDRNGIDQQQKICREIARAIRELSPTLRHIEAREELELLALRYQRLAEFREELSLLHSLPLYGMPRSH
jgi:hypothetical protein